MIAGPFVLQLRLATRPNLNERPANRRNPRRRIVDERLGPRVDHRVVRPDRGLQCGRARIAGERSECAHQRIDLRGRSAATGERCAERGGRSAAEDGANLPLSR